MSMKKEHATAREELLRKMKENKEFLKSWEDEGKQKHATAMSIKQMREKRELKFELTTQEKNRRTLQQLEEDAKKDMMSGIAEFEKTLERMGKDSKSASTSSKKETYGIILEGKEEETKQLMEKDARMYITKIKAKKAEEAVARKDREQRRRKIMIEQQRVFKEIEEKRRRELLLQTLMKQSSEERKLAKELMETSKWKEVIRENRILREKQYQERKELDYANEQLKLQEIAERLKEERRKQIETMQEKWRLLEEEKLEKKKMKHFNLCNDVFDQIIELAMREIEFKIMSEGEEPTTREREEWKMLFLSGQQILQDTIVPVRETTESSPIRSNASVELLDIAAFTDYVSWKAEWALQENPPVENKFTLEILKIINTILNPPEKPLTTPLFESKLKVNAVLIGKPLSGKSIISSHLSSTQNMVVIDIETILAEDISEVKLPEPAPVATTKSVKSKQPEPVVEAPVDPFNKERKELIEKCKQMLATGKALSEELMVQLIVNEIKRVENNTEHYHKGWIIDGFPSTLTAAKLLEKALSGYEVPVPQERVSRLFPNEVLDPEIPPQVKAFTSVIFIDVDNNEVFNRAAEQLVDPVTNSLYHSVYNPAPEKNEDVLKRLVPIDEIVLDRVQLSSNLIEFNRIQKELVEWYSRFNNLYIVDGMQPLEAVFAHVIKIIQSAKSSTPAENVTEVQPASTEAVPSESTDKPVEEVKTPLDEQAAKLFFSEWVAMEELLVVGIKDVFRNLRSQRRSLLEHFDKLKLQFIKFLLAPDDKQQYVSKFQQDFNQIEEDVRGNDEIKQELHKRLDELRDALWSVSDKRKEAAEKELKGYQEEKWLPEYKKAVTRQYMQLMQLEVNRFVHSSLFLRDYYNEIYSRPPFTDGQSLEEFYIDILSAETNAKKKPVPSASGKKPNNKTSGKEIPDTLEMASVYERAKGVVDKMKEIEENLAKQKAKKTEKKKTKETEPSIAELDEALALEKDIFDKRINKINDVFKNHEKDIDARAQRIYKKMDDWIGARFKSEMESVAELRKIIQDHIEQEKPVVSELRLEADSFVIDDQVMTMMPQTSPKFTHTSRPPKRSDKAFVLDQLLGLKQKFEMAAPSGYISSADFANIFMVLIDSSFGTVDLPEKWKTLSREAFLGIAAEFDPYKKDSVNWKEFILSVALMYQAVPTPTEVANMAFAMITRMQDAKGPKIDDYVDRDTFNKVKLWFERENRHPSMEASDIKDFIFSLLAEKKKVPQTQTEIEAVCASHFLLFACLDMQTIKTISKAFVVLSQLNPKNAGLQVNEKSCALTIAQLYKMFHFNIPVEKANEMNDEFSVDQLKVVFGEYKKKPNAETTILYQEFANSAVGRLMVTNCKNLKKKSLDV